MRKSFNVLFCLLIICLQTIAFTNHPFLTNHHTHYLIKTSQFATVMLPEHNQPHPHPAAHLPSSSSLTTPMQQSADLIALPVLTPLDLMRLSRGERIQKQSREGRAGNGVVVVDVPADADSVFQILQQFERYNELIPTIRAAKISRTSATIAKAEYSLSKFMLRVNVEHTIIPEQRIIKFSLDSARPNMVLRRAEGMWCVEPTPDKPSHSRVYLTASIVASKVVPSMIVDYAASRALPRATNWLKPYFAGLPHDEGPFPC